jgi:hypothetical protein
MMYATGALEGAGGLIHLQRRQTLRFARIIGRTVGRH